MKYHVKRFKDLQIALKQLAPFIRHGEPLRTGKPIKNFGDMRPREALANWLVCAVKNAIVGVERFTVASDPTGGDGIICDRKAEEGIPTEHVMVPPPRQGENRDIEARILEKIEAKQKKGGAAYASGKLLIVFLESGGGCWNPNQVSRELPKTDFGIPVIVGLQYVERAAYVYGVTKADLREGNAPTWNVRINPNFDAWTVERIQ